MLRREDSAGYMTNWAARLFAKMVDRQLKPYGITSAHLPILFALGDGKALSQKALTEAAAVEQPTMAATLSRMERDGLITRIQDPDDKRSSLFSLTVRAKDKFTLAQKAFARVNAEALADMTEEERALYLGLLRKITKSLERMAKA